MKLAVPFVQLPLSFDAATLAAEVQAIGDAAWRPHPQGFPGNSMLPLIAVGGDPANEGFAGAMQPTPHLARCPYLMQALGALGATLGRTRLMRLSGHAEVTRHADQGYYWVERVRVHVPIVTQPTVRFICGEAEVNMAAGECWIFDTWRQHRVLNDAVESRIHLVADTVGGERFWQMVSAGRTHDRSSAPPGWQPARIAPAAGEPPKMRYESVNVPAVMSPWELNTHLGFLFAESPAHPQLPAVQRRAALLGRQWQALWACHGEQPEGRIHFRAALDAFMRDVKQPASQIVLRNELLLFSVLMTMIGRAAVDISAVTSTRAPSSAAVAGAYVG